MFARYGKRLAAKLTLLRNHDAGTLLERERGGEKIIWHMQMCNWAFNGLDSVHTDEGVEGKGKERKNGNGNGRILCSAWRHGRMSLSEVENQKNQAPCKRSKPP